MRKSNRSLPVTQKQLQREVAKLNKQIKSSESLLRLDIISSFLSLKHEMQEFIKQAHDKIFMKIDPILKEVLASREKRVIVSHNLSELGYTIEDHETRITNIEQLQKAA